MLVHSHQDYCQYFLVLETDAGTTLLTEKLSDGTVQTLVEPAACQQRPKEVCILGWCDPLRALRLCPVEIASCILCSFCARVALTLH